MISSSIKFKKWQRNPANALVFIVKMGMAGLKLQPMQWEYYRVTPVI